jgi:hypothetical protein
VTRGRAGVEGALGFRWYWWNLFLFDVELNSGKTDDPDVVQALAKAVVITESHSLLAIGKGVNCCGTTHL